MAPFFPLRTAPIGIPVVNESVLPSFMDVPTVRIQTPSVAFLATRNFSLFVAGLLVASVSLSAHGGDLNKLVEEVDFTGSLGKADVTGKLPQLPGHESIAATPGMLETRSSFKMPVDVAPPTQATRKALGPIGNTEMIHGATKAAVEMAPKINFNEVFKAAEAQPTGHRLIDTIVSKVAPCDAPATASCDSIQPNPFACQTCEVLPPQPCQACNADCGPECGPEPEPPTLRPHVPAQLPAIHFYQYWNSDPAHRDVWNGYQREDCKFYEGCPPVPKAKKRSCNECGDLLPSQPACPTSHCDTCR